jgi:hypothetical protein
VNNIGPGAVFTPIDADVEAKPEMEKALMSEIPLGRWGKPEEIAGLAVYLASDEAAYITGSHISSTAGCCGSPEVIRLATRNRDSNWNATTSSSSGRAPAVERSRITWPMLVSASSFSSAVRSAAGKTELEYH